jgi:hypothetical protein
MGSDSQGHLEAWVSTSIELDSPEVQLWQALGVPLQPCFRVIQKGRSCFVFSNTAADAPVAGAAGGGGQRALDVEDYVAIVAAPGRTDAASYDAPTTHREKHRDRVVTLDGPMGIDDIGALTRAATTVRARAVGRRGGDSDAPGTGSACL